MSELMIRALVLLVLAVAMFSVSGLIGNLWSVLLFVLLAAVAEYLLRR